jgi:IS5 family transposase
MVSLHYLKHTFDLSDEAVLEGWVQNPYWQHLGGVRYFQHAPPIDPSSMSRWRGRAGRHGMEELLRETIRAGLKMKAITPVQMQRVNIDTTVEEKHVRFPTDSRLCDRARVRLVKQAAKLGIPLRQTYVRTGRKLFLQQSRYAHARQFNRARACQKKLRTLLGRVIRDIERNAGANIHDPVLSVLLERAKRIHAQQRHDKDKLYSVHAPEVECICKGKVHKRYEFGVKASIVTSSKGGWHLGAMTCPGNPYDGHTLAGALEQLQRLHGTLPAAVFIDMGYRGHGVEPGEGMPDIHVDKRRRGRTPKRLWKWMKRRAAVEPGIGHLKSEHRLDRNRLWGEQGDMLNVILSAAAMNFRKLLRHAAVFLRLLLERLATPLGSAVTCPSVSRLKFLQAAA